MMEISKLSDSSLLSRTEGLAREERQTTLKLLHHLREIHRRRLFAAIGYPSLFAYLTEGLSYSEAAAQRRIEAMRALSDLPELEPKIESGALTLSVVARAQTFFKQEAQLDRPLDLTSKREILESLEGKSSRETDRILASQASEVHAQERARPVGSTQTELKVVLSAEAMADLEQLRAIFSHQGLSYGEIIARIAKDALQKLDPARETKRSLPTSEEATQQVTLPRALRREVFRRDRSRCTYRDAHSGRVCARRHWLEPAHILAVALGGSHSLENLTLRCFQHNQLRAARDFGFKKMERYWTAREAS